MLDQLGAEDDEGVEAWLERTGRVDEERELAAIRRLPGCVQIDDRRDAPVVVAGERVAVTLVASASGRVVRQLQLGATQAQKRQLVQLQPQLVEASPHVIEVAVLLEPLDGVSADGAVEPVIPASSNARAHERTVCEVHHGSGVRGGGDRLTKEAVSRDEAQVAERLDVVAAQGAQSATLPVFLISGWRAPPLSLRARGKPDRQTHS